MQRPTEDNEAEKQCPQVGESNLGQLSDGELIRRYADERHEDAFRRLVNRHKALVFFVCRGILRHEQDAEDAFQATFLVLARKAGAVRWRTSLAGWLYATACRIALKASARVHKTRLQSMETDPIIPDCFAELATQDANRKLHEELSQLPERYRAPLVLCYLDGKSLDDAAKELGLKRDQIKWRLEKGRQELRLRLARRGDSLMLAVLTGGGFLLTGLGNAGASPISGIPIVCESVVASTVDAATKLAHGGSLQGVVSNQVLTLAKGEFAMLSVSPAVKSAIAIAAIAILGISVAFALTFEESAAEQQPEIEVVAEISQPASKDDFVNLTLVDNEKPAQNSAPGVLLDEAIASFNENSEQRLADLPDDKRPAPLTMDKVLQAIRDWKPTGDLDENTQQIIQRTIGRIAETKTLPRGAKLESDLLWWGGNWYDVEKYGEDEVFKWRVQLSAMISETRGFSILIQEGALDRRRALRPAVGYQWKVHPWGDHEQPGGYSAGGVVFSVDHAERDTLTIMASWVPAWVRDYQGEHVHGLRVVAFDEEGRRYLLKERGIGSHNELRMSRFSLDFKELPASDVRHLGIESMDERGLEVVSSAAVKQARDRGIDVLGLPKIGQRYGFTLTTADGRVVDSKQLEGRVVLIDCWASWCGPCMEMMPEIKETYDKWHAKGLEVIGVSFDEQPSDAEAAYKQHSIQWPLVIVPGDVDIRKLWDEASRITSLPTVLLIDRQGILRHDLSSSATDVDAKVASLIEQSSIKN